MNHIFSEAKDCIGCSDGGTKTCGLCCSARKFSCIIPSNDFKTNNLSSQFDVVHKTCCQFPIWIGKEDSHLVWQESQKNVKGAQINWKKRSNFSHVERDVCQQEKNFGFRYNAFSGRGLLTSPLVSPLGCNNAAHIKNMVNKESLLHRRMHGVSVNSFQWAAQQRLNGEFYKYFSWPSQLGAWESDHDKFKSYNFSEHENNFNGKKGLGGYGGNFFWPCDKSVQFQIESSQFLSELNHYKNCNAAQRTIYNSQRAESRGSYRLSSSPTFCPLMQQNVPHSTNLSVPGQGLLNGFQPHNWMKIPRMEDVSGRYATESQMLSDNKDKYKRNVTSEASKKKWIPVGKKASRPLKQTSSARLCNNFDMNLPFSLEVIDSHPEGNKISHSESPTYCDSKYTSNISSHKMTSVKSESQFSESFSAEVDGRKVESGKDYVTHGKGPKFNSQFLIGSHIDAEALKAACLLQLASEDVQLAKGYPLAEFERFVYSATPAIASSCVYEKCTVCMDDQLSHGFLCRHQIPNVSLRAVWNWYEKPGNYGLDVKAEDSQNLNGLPIESTSFRAHFVPFLSAVQLFGYPHLPKCSGESSEHTNLEIQDRGEVESHVSFPKIVFVKRSSDAVEVNHCLKDDIETAVNFDSVEEPVSSSKFSPCNESDDLGSDRLTTYCDTELIFEFFESEQPQHRKTLHDKYVIDTIFSSSFLHQIFYHSCICNLPRRC